MTLVAGIAFVVAGALGASTRFLLDGVITARTRGRFPLGTLVINASGSFLLGVLTGLGLYHGFPAVPRTVLGTGFCGAYTTFSTFSFETVRLLEEGVLGDALRNAFGTLLVCGLAAAVGLGLAAL